MLKRKRQGFDYPVLQPADRDRVPPMPVRLSNQVKSYFPARAHQIDERGIELRCLAGPVKPLSPGEVAVLFLTHDDIRFLPSFFRHYRSMGVTRFVCVDDVSSDGTLDYLNAQADVDVHVSNVRYREANRGKIWRERLLALYGRDRWYLIVDSDEYLVYETLGSESLFDFARRLDSAGVRRLPAPMLDLYPTGDLRAARFDGRDDKMPWEVATHFDSDGYRGSIFDTGLSLYGGVRKRVFGAGGEMMKYPLMFWDRWSSLGRTIHRPKPATYNFPQAMGALLHFKIFSDIESSVKNAVTEGQHNDQSKIYRLMLEKLESEAGIMLPYSGSLRFRGVDDLVARRFLVPLKT